MNKSLKFIFVIMMFKTALPQPGYQITDSTLFLKAVQLSKDFLIVDTHIDLPGWLYDEWFDVSQRTNGGEFDYPRAIDGGLDVAFMSIYTSPSLEGTGTSKIKADSMIALVNKMVSEWPDKFCLIRSTSEITGQINKGKILLAIGMENGSPIENNLQNLTEFFNKGIRYITLAHYKWNHISDSANDPERKWNGISPFGEEVIKEMNRLGIMIDVSHISDSAFYDVIRFSKAPVIASHSCCRFFVPGFERNMSDEMIKTLAENDGVIQINFANMFLRNEIYQQMEAGDTELKNYFEHNSLNPNSTEAKEYSRTYTKEHPLPKATVKDVADHIDHVVGLVGADHVGLGSDFNGVGKGNLPIGLADVSEYPNLIYELLVRGYSDEDIKKILGGNLLRVWKQVENIADSLK
jgi:membrane dipeptidase